MAKSKYTSATGRVVRWDDEKGFGFIRDKRIKHAEIFFHISAVENNRKRPKNGSRVNYVLDGNPDPNDRPARKTTKGNKPKADVSAARSSQSPKHHSKQLRAAKVHVKGWVFYKSRAFQSFVLSLCFIAGVFVLGVFQRLPLLLTFVYLLMSVLTYFVYYRDKLSAIEQGQRVSEMKLHVLAFSFGWPGANFAHQSLRHKSQKKRFRVIYYLTVLLNTLFLLYLLHPKGAWLNELMQIQLFQEYVSKIMKGLF